MNDNRTSQTHTKASNQASRTCTARLIVLNAFGLHARPAAMLVKTAQEYDSEIVMTCGGHNANAKSIIELLMLGAAQGMRVTLTAVGRDARDAIRAIDNLFTCVLH